MHNTLLLYAISSLLFVGIDMLWLTGIARSLYTDQLGHLMAPTPNSVAAVLFYVLFPIGIVVFGFHPTTPTYALSSILKRSALYGFLAYATYDLTNLATLERWPVAITVIDIAWGTLLTTVVAGLTVYLSRCIHPQTP